jgi:polyphosphate glucokinase
MYLGDKAFNKKGVMDWNKRLIIALDVIKTVFNYDHLYIGGGNAAKITFPLDGNMTIVTNKQGIKGGARLWQDVFKNQSV